MDERPILVCIPADTATLSTANSTSDRKCERCGTAVLLTPSGQRFLKSNPTLEIICLRCFEPKPDDVPGEMAATAEEMADELRKAQPNLYRNRN